jgi:hypothetical protein
MYWSFLFSPLPLSPLLATEDVHPFRSSLFPLTIEALICTQDWLKNYSINNEEEFEDFSESYDEHDKCLRISYL